MNKQSQISYGKGKIIDYQNDIQNVQMVNDMGMPVIMIPRWLWNGVKEVFIEYKREQIRALQYDINEMEKEVSKDGN